MLTDILVSAVIVLMKPVSMSWCQQQTVRYFQTHLPMLCILSTHRYLCQLHVISVLPSFHTHFT